MRDVKVTILIHFYFASPGIECGCRPGRSGAFHFATLSRDTTCGSTVHDIKDDKPGRKTLIIRHQTPQSASSVVCFGINIFDTRTVTNTHTST